MKISPTAIRQKSFETSFRGYEKKQVTDFLEEMSVVMEQINQENLELRSRLQQVEGEAKRLKDVEDSLFRTLKTAEDTGAAIITEATDAADQIIAEANQIAEDTSKQAQRYSEELGAYAAEQARIITSAAEETAKETLQALTDNIKGLVKSYEGLVEQREALVKSLRRLSQDALNQIDLSETHFSRIDAKAYQRAVEELSRSNHFSAANAANLVSAVHPIQGQQKEVRDEEPKDSEPESTPVVEADASTAQHLSEEETILFHEEQVPATATQVLVDAEEATEEEILEQESLVEEEGTDETIEALPTTPLQEVQTEPKSATESSAVEELEVKKEEKEENGSGSFFDQFD